MTGQLLGWTLVLLGAGVAVGNLVRMTLVSGWARYEAGAEVVMGVGMAVMAAPPTAALYGTYGMWWAAVFGLLCLGGVALAVRQVALLRGVRHLSHRVHLVVGSAAMVLMTLAMPGSTSGPVLALAGSSGHGHGAMPGMQGMAGMEGMEGMAGMGAHGMTEAAASSGSSVAWRAIFWVLAAYFLVFMALAVRTRMRGAAGAERAEPALVPRARHRRAARAPAMLSVPNARLAGHIGMGGSMATMLLMMAA
ncbi:DUF5134 domain-containing protein [Streptomyces sp. NPDC046862]|uniref:DUF5134 domain-containing protein n=1 Tax=Streptomyces sp. NPDC046862 TaxID=3154603 RepID=UPI0034529DF6